MDELELELGPEWAALELLCVGQAEDNPNLLARLLAAPRFHWGELVEQALRHQMLPFVALHALELAERNEVRIPGRLAQHLSEVLNANRWRMSIFRREATRIAEEFRALGVRFVATKGITFESTIYRGSGIRSMKDLDFMIAPGNRDVVAKALENLGYRPGNHDRALGRVVPHSRRQQMVYALHPDHLPRHCRLTDDPCVPFLYLDVANSLTWSKSPYQVPVEEALQNCVELRLPGIAEAPLPCFGPDYQFLFTVLHLFREAWLEQWVDLELDVSLMKFGDVIRLFEAHRPQFSDRRFPAFLESLGVAEPVAWVLVHTDRTFGTRMAAQLGLGDRVDESWLAGAHPSFGKARQWRGTMRQRLWAKDRNALFERTEPGSGPPRQFPSGRDATS